MATELNLLYTFSLLLALVGVGFLITYKIYGLGIKFNITTRVALAGVLIALGTRIGGAFDYGSREFYYYVIPLYLIIVVMIVLILRNLFQNFLVPIEQLTQNSNKIIEGEKSIRLEMKERKDEFGNLSRLLDKLVQNVVGNAEKNMGIARLLATSADDLSIRSNDINLSSENIAQAQSFMAKGTADQLVNITNLQQILIDLNKNIQMISEKIGKINDISDLIASISAQTNMLSLNAAIEAARAGSYGKGFGVVADQVRKLADESKKAVANTAFIVKEIQGIIESEMNKSLDAVNAIDEIARSAEDISTNTEETAAAAEEQAASVENVRATILELQDISQQLLKGLS